jgi:DNA (cytosine-5)-methyltransferase 1
MGDLTVIDIFCGAGGFSEGFKQQGFTIVAGIDSWKPAIDTFNLNFGLDCEPRNVLDFSRSLSNIESLPDTDVIIGSPPCVSFSSSNRSGKADKSEGLKLTRIFLRIVAIKKYKPNSTLKAWFMENVTNSKIHLPKQYSFRDLGLKNWATELGYDPGSIAINLDENRSVINSADYGVPQHRVRVFTGEIINKKGQLIPQRTHQPSDQSGELPEYITLGFIKLNLPMPNAGHSEVLIIDPLYPIIKIKQADLTDQFYDTGLYISDWKGSKYLKTNHPYMGPMSFPEREDRPSRTITATKIGNSRESIIFRSESGRVGHGEYRTPTIREAATLMGFPITFQFLGSEGGKWKLVGNAVCPPVSGAFARAVREIYELDKIAQPIVRIELPSMVGVANLNIYRSKSFDDPPKKKEGSRFRRHPFKFGNITVTLSNYDIAKNDKPTGKWLTSIQYGTGAGFPIQLIPDGYFKELEPVISSFEKGSSFLYTINNGFSGRIASAELLQDMYEAQQDNGDFINPIDLIDEVGTLIESIDIKENGFDQDGKEIFLKRSVPVKQVMALYAINKICSIANGGGL